MVFYNRLGAFVEFDMTPAMPTRWTMPTLAGLFHLERWFGGADTDQAVWVNGIDGPYLAALAAWRTSSWQTVRLADRTASGRLRSTEYRDISFGGDRYINDRVDKCLDSPGAEFSDKQSVGYIDVNGDGVVDDLGPDGTWINSATGHGLRRWLTADTGLGVPISESVGRCDESAEVVAALTDLDGDGLPDILRVQDQLLTMESMVPGAGDDLLAVGRLRMITNAQGAVTTIGYANAKIDRVTAHAVPFPEIVVSSVRTRVVDGSAQDDATTYYRYGGASYVYDGKSARWVFPGYRRHLVLAGRSIVKAGEPVVSGVLTASDFDPTAPAGSDFTTVATASRLRVVSHAEETSTPRTSTCT
ncbi:MAG: hypothetical protein IPL61_31000 [Myxococcales bacterium]|nr:hypothetical protein [Myxococcales bacterium]